MTLSEYEERSLAEIETGCRVEDPAFAARLDWGAAHIRSTRQTLIAACAIWVGSLAFVVGIVAARGGAPGGILVACCAAPAVVAGVLVWFRDRVRVRGTAHRRQ
jgi:hypothetical protein